MKAIAAAGIAVAFVGAGAIVAVSAGRPQAPGPSAVATGSRPGGTGAGAGTTTVAALNLPRIPWEGGADYYRRFPDSVGWSDPTHFPIGVWWATPTTPAQFAWDKAHGITFYAVSNPDVSQAAYEAAGAQLLASGNGDDAQGVHGVTGWDPKSAAWAGGFLGDEVDARFDPPAKSQAEITKQRDLQTARFGGRKLLYANFTGIVASNYNPEQIAADNTFVNMYDGPVSVDQYWYSVKGCEAADHVDRTFVPVRNDICHSASSYGHTVDSVRARDASDGSLKPVWNFVELGGGVGGDTTGPQLAITPEQLQGAVMMSLIHEARGIVYFNQSFTGPCTSGDLVRSAEAATEAGDPAGGCAGPNVAAAGKIDALIASLAPVLNSQSYQWSFGSGLDTMLKAADGYAYVFAMTHEAGTGSRTLTLPPGVTGDSVEVVGESRTLPVRAGAFTDTFATEASFHVYRIRL